MIIIRKMLEKDLSEVVEIEQSCFTSDAWSESSFVYAMESDELLSLTAEIDGRVAGYIVVTRIVEASIDSIAVSPEYRRQGVAEKLIWAALEGFSGDVFLEVRQSNLAARELYKKLGFEEISVRKNYYEKPTENAIIMKTQLCFD